MQRKLVKFIVPVILLLIIGILHPVTIQPVMAQNGYTVYANLTTGDNDAVEVWGANWSAQTFNTSTSYTVNLLRLKLYKEGTPGTLTASIRATNTSGYPTGTDLCSGTYNASLFTTSGAWYDVIVDEITLDVNTTYAIVVRGTGVNTTNNIHWRQDNTTATYVGGSEFTSVNGGAGWSQDTDEDYMFEVWGKPTIDVIGANVFQDYIYEDDWLIAVRYENVFEPYYSEATPRDSFYMQLTLADDTLISQTPLMQWGYMPGSIYLANTTTAGLDWGSAYKVKITNTANANYTESHTLTSSDWRGTDLDILKDWCISTAAGMESYYDTSFTETSVLKGDTLNEEGGVIFSKGIPYLSTAVPEVFSIVSSGMDYTAGEATNAYVDSLPSWSEAMGPTVAGLFNDTGTLFGIEGQDIAQTVFIILFVAIAGSAFAIGHGNAGMALATPILILGTYFRVLPWQFIMLATIFVVVMVVRQFVWRDM